MLLIKDMNIHREYCGKAWAALPGLDCLVLGAYRTSYVVCYVCVDAGPADCCTLE